MAESEAVPRELSTRVLEAAATHPVVTIVGPREAGKATLCRSLFPTLDCVSLAGVGARGFADTDPIGFLAAHPAGAIVDDVTRAPHLWAHLNTQVAQHAAVGQFVLTSSRHPGGGMTATLGDQTAILHLLPLSLAELNRASATPTDLAEALFRSAFPEPAICGRPPQNWLDDYLATYIDQDAYRINPSTRWRTFRAFLKCAAGRTSLELNCSALGSSAGISHQTARIWVTAMERSFLVFRVPAWRRAIRRLVIATPKMHFLDAGLAGRLIGIENPAQLVTHPLRGALFETWVATEVLKSRLHRGLEPGLFHYREVAGPKIDLVVRTPRRLILVNAHSGATVNESHVRDLGTLRAELLAAADCRVEARLVHGGGHCGVIEETTLVPWSRIHEFEW